VAIALGPIVAARTLGKRFHIPGRIGYGGPQRFVRLHGSRHEFRLADGELVRRQARAVKAFRQFRQRLIPARPHRFDNDASLLFDGRIEQAGGREHAPELGWKIRLAVRKDIHAASKLEEGLLILNLISI